MPNSCLNLGDDYILVDFRECLNLGNPNCNLNLGCTISENILWKKWMHAVYAMPTLA